MGEYEYGSAIKFGIPDFASIFSPPVYVMEKLPLWNGAKCLILTIKTSRSFGRILCTSGPFPKQ
jgi:hypothetical protein